MDNYIVSARKYRPASFESVVGQKGLTDTLRNAIRRNQLAHAYLFCGPRGVGKTTCARIFAKTINCLNPTADHDACNECESCRAFNEQRSFNIHELDAASNNSVEDIRKLISEVQIPPQIGKYSVYIIDEVHMLSQGAFNALLKTLEEPPSYAVFILATTEKHKILPTILSRCQVYDFQRITIADIVAYLQYVAKSEGIEAEEEALGVVAQKADGGMRDALSVFDQLVAYCGGKITYKRTIEVLNILDTDYYFRLTDNALRGDVQQSLLLLDEVLRKGFDAGVFVTGFASHLRDVLVSKDAATASLLETSDSIREQYVRQAAACSNRWLFQALDLINTCDIQYRTSRNKRLTVELCLVKLCSLVMPQQAEQQPIMPNAAVQQTAALQQSATQTQNIPAQPQPKQTAPVLKTMPKMPSVKIAQAETKPTVQPEAAAGSSTAVENSPFTADLLNDAWAGLKSYFPREERLLAMLADYKPVIVSPQLIRLVLTNPWQKEEFARFGKQIMDYIRRTLHNSEVRMQVDVEEQDSQQKAYTSSDKYKLMVARFPDIAKLQAALKLQLD